MWLHTHFPYNTFWLEYMIFRKLSWLKYLCNLIYIDVLLKYVYLRYSKFIKLLFCVFINSFKQSSKLLSSKEGFPAAYFLKIMPHLLLQRANLVKTDNFGIFFEDHFRLDQYFSKRFLDSFLVFQYGYFGMQHAYA